MKPKTSKSSSQSQLHKKNSVCVSHKPISNFFKLLSTSEHDRSQRKFPPIKTPTSSNTVHFPRPKKSPAARQSGLTPVKLKFEFDFTKISSTGLSTSPSVGLHTPPPSQSPSTPTPPPTLSIHTPPLTPTLPPTPKSQHSHQSPPSSVEAPSLSPITPQLPKSKKFKFVTTRHKKRKSPKKKTSEPNEIILISSNSSSESDVCQKPKKLCRTKRDICITINSSESDGFPEHKRRRISKDKVVTTIPSIVKTSSSISKKQAKCDTSVVQLMAPKQSDTSPTKSCSTLSLVHPKQTKTPSTKSCPTLVASTKSCPTLVAPAKSFSTPVATKQTVTSPTTSYPVIPKSMSPKSSSNPILPKSMSSKPSSESAVLKVPRYLLETSIVQDRQSEVLTLLWKRSTPHLRINDEDSPRKVSLLNTAQRTFVEIYLDSDCHYLSDKFVALAGYLTTVTSATGMPRGENIATLFLLLSDSKVSSSRLHPTVRDACVRYFSHLLHVHPPGSDKVVDTQYRVFLDVLSKRGQVYSMWEYLQTLARLSGHCCHLLSFLVDLLLSDYWATLHNTRSKPLFLQVFWAGQESPRINSTVRELLKELNNLLQSFAASNYEFLILDSLCTLLYLCGCVCHGLSTELVSLCLSLPSDSLHTLLGHIHSLSLYLHLYQALPTEKTRTVFVDCQELKQKNNGVKLKHRSSGKIEQKNKRTTVSIATSSKTVLKPTCSLTSKQDKKSFSSTKEEEEKSSAQNKVASTSWTKVSHGQSKFSCVRKRVAFQAVPRRPISEAKLITCENCKHQTCLRCTESQSTL